MMVEVKQKATEPETTAEGVATTTTSPTVEIATSELVCDPTTNAVVAGTRDTFITKAIECIQNNTNLDFARTLCLTHCYISDSIEFLERIVEEKGFRLLQLWLEEYYYQFLENKALKRRLDTYIEQWNESKRTDLVLMIKNASGKGHLNRAMARLAGIQRTVSSKLPKQTTHAPEAVASILDIPAIEAAKQICIIEHQLFESISLSEFISRSRDKTAEVPKLSALIRNTNKMIYGIATDIVKNTTLKMRAIALNHWIEVAFNLRRLNNFNGLMEVIGALNLNPIGRLKKTWKALPERSIQTFDSLAAEMDVRGGYKVYRKILSEVVGPVIPFVGVYLSQLTFIEENPDRLPNGMWNFQKLDLVSKVVSEIQKFQKEPPNFVGIPSIQEYFTTTMSGLTEDELYEKSKACEPPESSDDRLGAKKQPKTTRVVNRKTSDSGEVVYIMPSIIRQKQGKIQAFRGVGGSNSEIKIHLLTPRPGETRVEILNSRSKPSAIAVISPRTSQSIVNESLASSEPPKKKKKKIPTIIATSDESGSPIPQLAGSPSADRLMPKSHKRKKKRTKHKSKETSDSSHKDSTKRKHKKHHKHTRKHKRHHETGESSKSGDSPSSSVTFEGIGVAADWDEPSIPEGSRILVVSPSPSRIKISRSSSMSSIAQSTSSGSLSVDARLLLDPPPVSVLDTIIEEPETEPPVDVLSRSLPESSPLTDLIQHFEEPFTTTFSSPPKVPTDQDERSGNDNKLLHLVDEGEHTLVASTTTHEEDDDDSSYFSESSESESSDEISEADYESSDDSYDESDQSDEADFFDSDTPRKPTPRYSSIDDLYAVYKASLAEESGSIINPASAITLSSSPAMSPLALQVSQSLSPKKEVAKPDPSSQPEFSAETDNVELAEKTKPLEENETPKQIGQEENEELKVNQMELPTSTEPIEPSKPQAESTEQTEPPKQIEQSEQTELATPAEQSEHGEEAKLDSELKIETSEAETSQTEQNEKVSESTAVARSSISIEFNGGQGKGSRIVAPLTNQVIVLQEIKLERVEEESQAGSAESETDETKQKVIEDGSENNDWRVPTLEERAPTPQTDADMKEESGSVEPACADIPEETKKETKTEVNVADEQLSVSEVKGDDGAKETAEEKVTDVAEPSKEAKEPDAIIEGTDKETTKDVLKEDVKEEVPSVKEAGKDKPAADVKESKDSKRVGGANDLLDPKEISRKKAKERAAQKFQERAKYKSKHKNEEDSPEQKEKTVTVTEDKKAHKETKERKKDKAKMHQMHRSKSTDLRRYTDDVSMLQPSISITSFGQQESDKTSATLLAPPMLTPITSSSSVPNNLVINSHNTPSPVASPSPSPTASPAGSLRKKKLSEKFESWLSKGSSDSKPSAAATLSAADAKRLKHSNSFSVRKSSGTYDKDEAEFATYFATLKRKTSTRTSSTVAQTSGGSSPLSGSPTSSGTPTTTTSSSPTSWLDRFLRKEKA